MKIKVEASVDFVQCLNKVILEKGEEKAAEYIISKVSTDFAEMLAHYACKSVSRQFYKDPDLMDIAPDYSRAVNFLAANNPTDL